MFNRPALYSDNLESPFRCVPYRIRAPLPSFHFVSKKAGNATTTWMKLLQTQTVLLPLCNLKFVETKTSNPIVQVCLGAPVVPHPPDTIVGTKLRLSQRALTQKMGRGGDRRLARACLKNGSYAQHTDEHITEEKGLEIGQDTHGRANVPRVSYFRPSKHFGRI